MVPADSLTTDTTVVSLGSQTQAPEKNETPIISKRRKKNQDNGRGTLFFIGLGAFLLFGLVRFFYNKYINALFSTLSRSSLWRLSANERLWQKRSVRYLFLLIYYLSAGFVVGEFINSRWAHSSEFERWWWGSAIIFGIYVFKYLVLQSVALVFRFKKVADEFFKHITVINQVLGLVFLPICGLLLLVPNPIGNILLIIAIVILSISLIFKFLVNIGYVRNLSKVNYMHFMVYLCTLEFIPLAVLARYLYSGMGV